MSESTDVSTHALGERMQTPYGENKRIASKDFDKSLEVTRTNGTFVGTRSGDVVAYNGVPFAGENRFKKPVPHGQDEGVYEAYHFAKVGRAAL